MTKDPSDIEIRAKNASQDVVSRSIRVMFAEVPILGGVLLATAGFVAGWLLRYQFIEPTAIGILCDEGGIDAPSWCDLRTSLIVTVQTLPGRVFVPVLAVLPWLVGNRTIARGLGLAALFFAGAGLILYNAGLAVVGVVVAGLRLIRLGKEPPQP